MLTGTCQTHIERRIVQSLVIILQIRIRKAIIMSRPVPAVFGSVFHAEMPVIAYREGKWQPVEWQSSKRPDTRPRRTCFALRQRMF